MHEHQGALSAARHCRREPGGRRPEVASGKIHGIFHRRSGRRRYTRAGQNRSNQYCIVVAQIVTVGTDLSALGAEYRNAFEVGLATDSGLAVILHDALSIGRTAAGRLLSRVDTKPSLRVANSRRKASAQCRAVTVQLAFLDSLFEQYRAGAAGGN